MNYLQNYILEQQVEYPSIFPTPTSVLDHLLFTNGNGCEIENGNFLTYFSNGKKVTWVIFYSKLNDRESCIENVNRYQSEKSVDDLFKMKCEMAELFCEVEGEDFDKGVLWKEAWEEWDSRYDNSSFVDEISWEELLDKGTLKNDILKGKYYPHLGLSPSYFKAAHFTESTCLLLKELTIVLSKAFVEVMEDIIKGDFSCGKESPLGGEPKELRKTYLRDIEILNNLVLTLEGE
ncbi:hypothetical protein VPH5P1C_0165 [Vibrio phage 5P1c]|nr:hypothetical protein VP193E371_P0164 [Vibrio phage 193E37-1]